MVDEDPSTLDRTFLPLPMNDPFLRILEGGNGRIIRVTDSAATVLDVHGGQIDEWRFAELPHGKLADACGWTDGTCSAVAVAWPRHLYVCTFTPDGPDVRQVIETNVELRYVCWIGDDSFVVCHRSAQLDDCMIFTTLTLSRRSPMVEFAWERFGSHRVVSAGPGRIALVGRSLVRSEHAGIRLGPFVPGRLPKLSHVWPMWPAHPNIVVRNEYLVVQEFEWGDTQQAHLICVHTPTQTTMDLVVDGVNSMAPIHAVADGPRALIVYVDGVIRRIEHRGLFNRPTKFSNTEQAWAWTSWRHRPAIRGLFRANSQLLLRRRTALPTELLCRVADFLVVTRP